MSDVKVFRRRFKNEQVRDDIVWFANKAVEMQIPLFPAIAESFFVDITMPKMITMAKMNEIEFLQELRKDPEPASIPAFVLTTSDEYRDQIDAYELNIAG